jgi:hypothetical protein
MFGFAVDLELLGHRFAEFGFRQHPFNREFNHSFRVFRKHHRY